MSAASSNRKRSFYIPDAILKEIAHEAERQDRSLSWMIQQAWKIARSDIQKLPAVTDAFKPKTPVPSYELLP